MTNHKTDYLKQWQGCPNVVDVARAYFPSYLRSNRAVDRFRTKIECTPNMLRDMLKVGYDPHSKYLTPAQVEVIIKYWKLPGHINMMAN